MDEPADAGDLMVGSRPRARGTHTIDYYVCDRTHLVPATLTVVLRDLQPVEVTRVVGRKGLLEVTNPNAVPIRFRFGHPHATKPDDVVKIAAGETRLVRVQRHAISWIALIGSGSLGGEDLFSTPGVAGHGVLKNIKINGKPLPKPEGPDLDDLEQLFGRWPA